MNSAALSETPQNLAAPNGRNHNLKVGDVLVAEWGATMLMVSFYQIRKLCGKASVQIEELEQQEAPTGFLSGVTVPLQDQFRRHHGNGVMLRRVKNGKVYIKDYIVARKHHEGEVYHFDHCD